MIELYNEDCLTRLDSLIDSGVKVDAILTSPPYNFGIDYGDYKDDKDFSEYFNWLDICFDKFIKILKSSGRFIINIQPMFSSYQPTHHIISSMLLKKGLLWKGEILWEKNNYNCAYTAWGSWKSPSSPYFKYTWEFIEIFCKDDYKKDGNKEDIDITANEFKQWVYAKWSIAPEHTDFHPAPFPEELPRRLLKLLTYKHDLILDPFMGSGTTGVVCKELDRNFIGIELDKKYFDVAEERISRAQKIRKLF